MLLWFNRMVKERKSDRHSHEEMSQRNEAQLVREQVSLEYDVIRSLVK